MDDVWGDVGMERKELVFFPTQTFEMCVSEREFIFIVKLKWFDQALKLLKYGIVYFG